MKSIPVILLPFYMLFLLFSLAVVTPALSGQLTLQMRPYVVFDVKAGHDYKLYSRSSLTDEWELSIHIQPTNKVSHPAYVDFIFKDPGASGFFWLQIDDEQPTSPIPTNTVISTNSPPVPGE